MLFKLKNDRKVEVFNYALRDAGTYVEFEAYYEDTNEDISDEDYYYIQEEYYLTLHELAYGVLS